MTLPQQLLPIGVPVHRGPSSRRIALYSHDTQGLGHIRRNIAVAGALARSDPDTEILLLTGNPEATTLAVPPRTDVVTLPTIAKRADGSYDGRRLTGSLDRVLAMRSGLIEAAIAGFDPDLLVVDKVPLGVGRELAPTLRRLRTDGRTRTVLGLRDVLDSAEVVEDEWRQAGTARIVARYYDQVWVYGDRTIFDPTRAYRSVATISDQVVFTGYLGNDRNHGLHPQFRPQARLRPPTTPYVLCLVGGGQDGMDLAANFARATMPAGHLGVLVTGPYLASCFRDELAALASGRTDLSVIDFIPDTEEFLAGAAAVVSMSGYNSVCEILAAKVPAMLVPRVMPRAEQAIRARNLAALGLVEYLEPSGLNPTSLSLWLAKAVQGNQCRRAPIDLAGLSRIPLLAQQLLSGVHNAA